jgi:hypothetical protein
MWQYNLVFVTNLQIRRSQPQSSHSWQFLRSSINNSQLFEFCYDKVTIVLTHRRRQVKATRMPMNECLNLNWLATINKTILANNNRIQYWQLQKKVICASQFSILLQIRTTYVPNRSKMKSFNIEKNANVFFISPFLYFLSDGFFFTIWTRQVELNIIYYF